MHSVIFPSGLKFTQLPYKQEWAEAQARLSRITSEGYDKEIQKLGGKPLLDQLLAAHKDYGVSLGITVGEQDQTTVRLRESLLAFNKYLRAYVVAVTAHTDPDDAASGALAEALLAPMHKWVTYVTVAEEEGDETLPGIGGNPAQGQTQGQTQAQGQTVGNPGVPTSA
jgi:predicted mannosyl-3-phosphoglycerate phosphatase (HAD superfamily)